ncbi:MAG: hypothetical protein RLY31_2025 [Bacteroidota bacterium]
MCAGNRRQKHPLHGMDLAVRTHPVRQQAHVSLLPLKFGCPGGAVARLRPTAYICTDAGAADASPAAANRFALTNYLVSNTLFPPLVRQPPAPGLGLVVVIPCHDEPDLQDTLDSLWHCQAPDCDTEVVVVFNHSENASSDVVVRQEAHAAQAEHWALSHNRPNLRLHVLFRVLPARSAGVGLARKIGMDEACYRLERVGRPDGVIACLDADCHVDINYLKVVYRHFTRFPTAQACGVHFEHPLSGSDFPSAVYDAVTDYELHLRYYVNAQRWCGVPHAWHTVGSSMAVRCRSYQSQGGMNRRKAGEDFYFLHKFIPLGGFTEIHGTCVYPSPRISDRVPFGTGRAVMGILREGGAGRSYHPGIFLALRRFILELDESFYHHRNVDRLLLVCPEVIRTYLPLVNIRGLLEDALTQTASFPAFRKRFWRAFHALQVLKFVHHARLAGYPDVPVGTAAAWLVSAIGKERPSSSRLGEGELLRMLRELDRAFATGGWPTLR